MAASALGFNSDNTQMIDKAKRRVASMLSLRAQHDKANYEVARFADVTMSPWMSRAYSMATRSEGQAVTTASSTRKNQEEINSKLLNDRAVWASNVCANGMYSGMSNPATPWFKITTEDPDLREYWPVKQWLAAVEERIAGLLARTNFYVGQKSGYLELTNYGTSAAFMIEHWNHQAVTFPMTWGEYVIGLDDANVASSLGRRADMTAIQIAEKFGRTKDRYDKLPRKVREALDKSNYQDNFEVWHLVEPNGEYDPERDGNLNMPYRDMYWMDDSGKPFLLTRGGFEERPFWAPRWDVRGTNTYGRGPGNNAYIAAKKAQLQEIRKQQAIDYTITPPLKGPAGLRNVHVSLAPKSVTLVPGTDQQGFEAIWQTPYQAVGLISQDIDKTEAAIDRMYFADLFLAITNMPGVQPRNVEEVARRNDEKLSQLGPAVERNENEQSKVAIQRAFGILFRTGQLPPLPDELQGVPLKIVFTSILSQLMRAIGVGSIERTLGMVGNIAAINPAVLDKIDFDQAVDEYADRVGAPPSIVRSDDLVAKIRQDRADQERAQQMATEGAPALEQGARAAELLSKTDVNSPSLLTSLMGP